MPNIKSESVIQTFLCGDKNISIQKTDKPKKKKKTESDFKKKKEPSTPTYSVFLIEFKPKTFSEQVDEG